MNRWSLSRPARIAGIALLLSLTSLVHPISADIPDKFTNLKVLPKTIDKEELLDTMRGFADALNVRCNYCHVREEGPGGEEDWASDKKPEKETARVMMRMTAMINGKELPQITTNHPDRITVECRTCHHGQARPRLIENVLVSSYDAGGMDSLTSEYESLREENYGTDSFDFGEGMLLSVGEKLAAEKHPKAALLLTDYNLRWFPESAFSYMTRGQIHAGMGDRQAAIADIQKAVELDPRLEDRAKRMLERLKEAPKETPK
jgi:tetratricopeptide (TPR) repeat protein